jgi:anterior pharynx defective protein 1
VVGLGFGMMSGAFSLVNVLADSVGPGTVGFHNEPQDFFMVSSLLCMPMIFLHTFWGVITFDALDRRRWLNLAYVWASHFLVSCLTLLNQQQHYWASTIPMYIVLVITAVIAFKVSGGQFNKVLACLKCSKTQTSETVEVQAPENDTN